MSSLSRILTVGVVLLLVVSGASVPVAAQSATDLRSNLDTMVSKYNENARDVNLGPAGNKLRGSAINLFVEDEASGEVTAFSFEMTSQQRIANVQEGTRADADYNMSITVATVERIARADNAAGAFRDAYARDDISIDPTYSPLQDPVGWVTFTAAESLKGTLHGLGLF